MNTQKTVLAVFGVLVLLGSFGYGGYHKGYSKAIADDHAELVNDILNSDDPSAKHSFIFSRAYTHGEVAGRIEARSNDITQCGDKLAQVIVETRDKQVAARLLVNGDILLSQLKAAEAQYEHKQTK
jgi:hypothetical protein